MNFIRLKIIYGVTEHGVKVAVDDSLNCDIVYRSERLTAGQMSGDAYWGENKREESISQQAFLYLPQETTLSQQIHILKVKRSDYVGVCKSVLKTPPSGQALSSRLCLLYGSLVSRQFILNCLDEPVMEEPV